MVSISQSLQLDRVLWALQHARPAGDTPIRVVKNCHSAFMIGRPTANRANLVALPDPGAPGGVKMDFQTPQGTCEGPMFTY